jgi:DedD protein
MPTAQQDTEITLGTGRMLAIFFTLVLVCAFFFAMGFSLGRKTAMAGVGTVLNASTGSPATVVRPSAVKSDAAQPAAQNDFGFYKAVGQKSADAALAPQEAKASTAGATSAPSGSEASAKEASDAGSAAATPTNGYYVQVAAVSRQEDAESLVEALKKKQYPAFTANSAATDKFFHVQVGPYADLKDAEAMRGRLISDGYTPIVKK